MTSIDIINNFLGEKLTLDVAKRISDGPEDHIIQLIEKLAPFYYDWFEKAEATNLGEKQNFFCVDPLNRKLNWQDQIEIYKKHLLYFPRFTVPDPLASLLWVPITAAMMTGEISFDDKFRQDFKNAFCLLAELEPAVSNSDVALIPLSFAIDYSSVQESARKELDFISANDPEKYYEPLLEFGRTQLLGKDSINLAIERMKVHGQICNRLNLTPVAGNRLIEEVLKQDFEAVARLYPTNRTHRVATAMFSFHVPGTEKASFNRIVELRNNESAFNDWRRNFAEIMDKVYQEDPKNENQFEKEFKEAADDKLKPQLNEIKKAVSSSVLDKILVPASLTIGAATSAFYIAELPNFPVTSIASASVAPVGWAIDKLVKRFKKSGRKAAILREFYGYLTESNTGK